MNKLSYSVLVFISLVCLSACSLKQKDEQKPNIIFLLTDDQRWDALGAMGNSIIQTPNMDYLANNGVLFTEAHVTTSICCSSRASILSGQYVSRHGINGFRTPFSEEAIKETYPLMLKDNGYSIGFIGKYGVGNPQDFPDSLYDYWGCDFKHQPNYENKDENGNFIHYTRVVHNRIMTFLDRFGTKEEPFCLSVSFKSPHCEDGDPRQFIYQEKFKDLYADVEIPLPETADSSFYYLFPEEFRNPIHNGKVRDNEAHKRWKMRFPDQGKYQETVRSYYRLVTGVDEVVGELREKLKELGKDDNTIIIFMGDNGFYLGEHGMAGKWYPHRESIKVPFFIYDPRAPKNERGIKVDDYAFNIDVAPTILNYAGIEVPKGMQGINALTIADGSAAKRTEFYYEHELDIPTIPKSRAVVDCDFKYIVYPELDTGFEEFYDLKNDPLEKINLVNHPKYGSVLEKYRKRLGVLKEEVK